MHAQDGRLPAGRRRSRAAALAAAGTIIGLGALSAPALADFDTTADAEHVAKAILNDPAQYVGAEFTVRPTVIPEDPDPSDDVEPDPVPAPTAALVTTALGGFPLAGPDYAALSSGIADEAHTLSNDKGNQDDSSFDDTPAMEARGETVHDMTTLRIDVDVPDGSTCLALSYRFYSEEFPEFVGSEYNDAFIAELDESTWTTDAATSSIQAPNDFATKAGGKPVSVNGVGPTAVDPAQSDGTIFDAATGLVTTKTPVTGGAHSVYLSIFDQGDHIYDSTVLVDRLAFLVEPPATCKPPEVPVITPPAPVPLPEPGPTPPPPPPANDFTVPGGSVQFNNGSATVIVQVPGPGTLTAGQAPPAGAARAAAAATTAAKKKKLVKPAKAIATQAGPVKLKIKPTKAGKKILKRKHTLKVKLNITFTPTGGTANTEQIKLTIKLKKKHKH